MLSWERVLATLTMRAALLSALLGVTLMLPGVQALTCQSGTLKSVMKVSALPLNWTASEKVCEDGLGCQDMLMIMENGPQVFLVLIKDCTLEEDHDARVTQHRAGPGLSIISYTHVCRQKDHCNDLSSSLPLWAPLVSPSAEGEGRVLGSMRCPLCLSMEDCESATELTCPVGHTHCYKGVLQLRGGGIYTNLRVQGCMSQTACNLLNQTQKIGPLSMSENCDTNAFLTCQQGVMIRIQQNLTQTPIQWNAYKNVTCDLEEVCQETLLLVDVGPKSLIVGSKNCSKAQIQESQTVTVHSAPPGVLVASYSHFCSSSGCNRASSSHVLLNSLPRPAAPAPGDLQCPICVGFHGSCVFNFEKVMCPKGTTHCYSGGIQLKGGGVSAIFSIQGCVAQPSSSLLNHTNNIGEFFTLEISEKKNDEPHLKEREGRHLIDGAAPGSYVVWVVGLGLSLALWCADSISP